MEKAIQSEEQENALSEAPSPPVPREQGKRTKRASPVLRTLGVCLLVCLLSAAGLFAAGADHYVFRPFRAQGVDERFVVRPGSTLRDVTQELEHRGFIRKAWPVRLWAALKGYGTRIKAGEYLLNPGLEPARILERFVNGEVIQYPVTIPEGFTLSQIARLLQEAGLADAEHFLALVTDSAAVKTYGFSGESLEGYLFPDTYHFSRGVPVRVIVDTLTGRFREILTPHRQAIEASGFSLHEVVTLASIVEKETGAASERPLIAGVFLNRLKKGMRLESDPTVIYGIQDFNGNLTRADLARWSAYNTYQIAGLPPGPIANPGAESIQAVLDPAQTDFLYFVSKNDGTHHFSKTFAEHTRAVKKYQKSAHRRSGKTS